MIIIWCSGTTAKGQPCKRQTRANRNKVWYCEVHARRRLYDTVTAQSFPPVPAGSGGMATEAYMDWNGR